MIILLRADKNRKSLANRQKCLNYSPQPPPPNKPFLNKLLRKPPSIYNIYMAIEIIVAVYIKNRCNFALSNRNGKQDTK